MNNINSKMAFKIDQPFGTFFVTVFKASELLLLTYSDTFRSEEGHLKGNQRKLSEARRKEIRDYITSVDCAFPNSIILAANYDTKGFINDNNETRWSYECIDEENNLYEISIPSQIKHAAIIDGQHRLNGFLELESVGKDMELVCSVYFDLPSSLQAFLFATINSTQKPVDKSLAYQLFGFELLDEEFKSWSPDKLAISICRKLDNDDKSPFYQHIKLINSVKQDWMVSVAAVVDGILRLISSNPKKDKATLHQYDAKKRKRNVLHLDNSPLRELYIGSRDEVIYKIILNFFRAAKDNINDWGDKQSAINKTIGIQALFDVLKYYININISKGIELSQIKLTEDSFKKYFTCLTDFNFSQDFFLKFSGVGRNRVRNVILIETDLYKLEDLGINPIDMEEYKKILS